MYIIVKQKDYNMSINNYGNAGNVKNSYDNQFYTLPDDFDFDSVITVDDLLTAIEAEGTGLGTVSPGSVVESLTKSINEIKSDNKGVTVKTLSGADNSFTIAVDFQEEGNLEVSRLWYGVPQDENGNQPINMSKLVTVNLVYITWDIDAEEPVAYIGNATATPNGDKTRQGTDIVLNSILFTFKGEPRKILARAS